VARRTVYIPDDLDERISAELDHGDSYSAIVSAGLERLLESDEWPDEVLNRTEEVA
jgi:hypothetical protein